MEYSRANTSAESFEPAPISISRRIVDPMAGDGTFLVQITNSSPLDRSCVYSETWPWWVKGWMSEMSVTAVPRAGANLSGEA